MRALSMLTMLVSCGFLLAACQTSQSANKILPSLTGKTAAPDRRPTAPLKTVEAPTAPRPVCSLASQDHKILKSPSPDDWGRFYESCQNSAVAAQNYAIALLNAKRSDEARRVLTNGLRHNPGSKPLADLDAMLNDPFSRVGQMADAELKSWLGRPSEVPAFVLSPPTKPDAPPLPRLVKDEFETTKQFRARAAEAEMQRAAEIARIENGYRKAVDTFNAAVSHHNQALANEAARRRAETESMRARLLGEALSESLGDPRIADLNYDADNGRFYGMLRSANGNFIRKITIKVPLTEARHFKDNIGAIVPVLRFTADKGTLQLTRVTAVFEDQKYEVSLTDKVFQPVTMTSSLEENTPTIDALSTMRAQTLDTSALLAENSSYFQQALTLENDPKLAKLKQEQAENERRIREAEISRAQQDEATRLKAQIRGQQARLATLGGPEAENLKGITPKRDWSFRHARAGNRDMIAVVIGNRRYEKGVPLVHYAHNDARAMQKFLTDGLGLPKENVILELDATKGILDGVFRSTLPSLVSRGKTDVLVYFSGHGMPSGDDAMLLPSDARPNTARVTGYSRDQMMMELASLDAKSLTVILDACFTGTTKTGKALMAGKPVLPEPGRATIPPNGLLVTASNGNQIAWVDEKAGMSLMTLHLLEGLSGKADSDGNNDINSDELKQYLLAYVNQAARRLYQQQQTPQVLGARRTLIEY